MTLLGLRNIIYVPGEEGAAMLAPGLCARQKAYVLDMMKCLGIEPEGGAIPRLGLSYLTLFRRCEACRSKKICREWLDRLAGEVHFAPRFCPNADIFFELKFDQAQHGQTAIPSDSTEASGIAAE